MTTVLVCIIIVLLVLLAFVFHWGAVRMRERDNARRQLKSSELVADLHLSRVLEAERALREERRRSDQYYQDIVQLRRDGFNPPPPEYDAPPSVPLAEPIVEALAQRAQPGSDLWRSMSTQAATLLEAGRKPEEIAEAILRGEPDVDAFLL